MSASWGEIIYRQATLAEIHPLRVKVLRPGQSLLSYPGDEAQTTRHFGAFVEELAMERNVGCVTILASSYENAPAFQLRGMAVEEGFRNQNVGGELIDFAEEVVTQDAAAARVIWCNARFRAIPFYERHGWKCVSEPFEVAGVGPHRVMLKRV